ncbi:YbbR-like domain-containing protein [Nonlabens xiamenensis]|uniref:hypothetical protein n=1 Tax=Nonlabens xiamenensis TaxID=2341043 RepID=UPI000F608D13|nr:hypothetical protein [Nonlabens xiamenensis]
MKIGYHRTLGFVLITVFVSILWFVSRYKDQYRETLAVQIQWNNIPADVMSTEDDLIFEIPLKVQASGYQLIWSKLVGKSLSLDFNASTFERNDSIFFNPDTYKEVIQRELNSGFELVQTIDREYHLPLMRYHTRYIPLRVDQPLGFQANFINLGEPKISHDSIQVTGNNQKIKELDILTISANTKNISDTLTTIVYDLSEYYPDLRTIPPKVSMEVRAAKVTEGTLTLPIELLNKGSNMVKIIPDQIELTYTITVENFLEVDPADFKAFVDYNNVSNNNQSVIPEIGVDSDLILSYRINPRKIQILTIK